MCVCVCVCEGEKERDKEREREKKSLLMAFYAISYFVFGAVQAGS